MGHRSDVGLAVRTVSIKEIDTKETRGLLEEAEMYEDEEGTLYFWESVKWQPTWVKTVAALEAVLKTLPLENYRLVEVGEEDHLNERGEWHDNPFALGSMRTLMFSTPG
jgi:hypothetical protein